MKPHLAKRSFSLAGHRTSIALEPEFWAALEDAARARAISLAALVIELDAARAADGAPLASTLRVFALRRSRAAASDRPPPPGAR